MRVTRPTYTEEFRRDAVALLKSTDRSFTQVAEDLGVSSFSLRRWYKGADVPTKPKKPRKGEAVVASGEESPEQKLARLERENQTLRKENDSLRMDREILKKAATSSRRKANEVRVHPRGEGLLSHRAHVPPVERYAAGLLRLCRTPDAGATAS